MILVSACLAGFPCRWDGEKKADDRVTDLVREGRAVPVCPEQLGGLTTPREPSEIKGDAVVAKSGLDVTEEFTRGAEIVLDIAETYGCSEAILKARSPSCGSCEIYDGSFTGKIIKGDGITAALLKSRGIRVKTEMDL